MVNWFAELSAVNVNDYVRQKNGLNYLSWMWAWQELKKRYPLSYATVHETEDGMLVWKDPNGCHVKTSVTIVWEDGGELKEHTVTEYLPCMDFKNKAVPYDAVDSMQVNKTIQRSLTKCIARLGLGSYLYVNEDLPEEDAKLTAILERVDTIAKKKAALSADAKNKVKELCVEAEKKANPEIDESLISGNYKNIEDYNILKDLLKQISYVK